jgi:hypothetical protein
MTCQFCFHHTRCCSLAGFLMYIVARVIKSEQIRNGLTFRHFASGCFHLWRRRSFNVNSSSLLPTARLCSSSLMSNIHGRATTALLMNGWRPPPSLMSLALSIIFRTTGYEKELAPKVISTHAKSEYRIRSLRTAIT